MSVKALVLAVFVGAVALVAYMALRGGGPGAGPGASPGGPTSTAGGPSDGPAPTTPSVTIDLLYGSEKEAWLKEALVDFAKAHPEIKVNTKTKGSLDAARDILDEKEKPTIWAPADTIALNLLAADWSQKTGKSLFGDGDDAPQPLLLTPLVFVAWEDRAAALSQGQPTLSWKRIEQVLSAPQGWAAAGGKAEWGFVKLGHTDPTRSNSGVQTLILMAFSHFGKPTLEIPDVLNADFQAFVQRIEKGVPQFAASSGQFMKDMILYGPSKFDLVVAYENLAIEQIPNAQGRWGNLKIYYPERTMWSTNPAAVLQADWVTAGQRAAGKLLLDFLRSRPIQERAVHYGFRPADPAVPVITAAADNPFHSAQAFGVKVELPPAIDAPAGPVIRNLMEMWNRLVRR